MNRKEKSGGEGGGGLRVSVHERRGEKSTWMPLFSIPSRTQSAIQLPALVSLAESEQGDEFKGGMGGEDGRRTG